MRRTALMKTLAQEILELKAERKAVILAHNYVIGEIQDIADFTGDSLELSIRASHTQADVIVFCGVRFMAETGKLLAPKSHVLLPNSSAGCPMADMASAEAVAAYRAEHPSDVLVAYVNSTAGTKENVDVCCTSGNVEKVISSIPADKNIMFLPDANLGRNMINRLGREMSLWKGCCPIHDAVTPEMIADARAAHPGVPVLVHPECRPEVVAASDFALSTGGILKYVRESPLSEFIIGTESGILHRLVKENPGRRFYTLTPELVCADMKKITLEDVRNSLRDMTEEIILPPELMRDALSPIEKMTSIV